MDRNISCPPRRVLLTTTRLRLVVDDRRRIRSRRRRQIRGNVFVDEAVLVHRVAADFGDDFGSRRNEAGSSRHQRERCPTRCDTAGGRLGSPPERDCVVHELVETSRCDVLVLHARRAAGDRAHPRILDGDADVDSTLALVGIDLELGTVRDELRFE